MQRKLWLVLAVAGSLTWGCGEPAPEICNDNIDNDQDGNGDCADVIDCSADPTCNPEGLCADGIDNDEDGAQDCADTDCDTALECTEINCGDGVDNDNDTDIDCADADCAPNALCQLDPEDCNVVGDEDGDGDADCADTDCAVDPDCQGPELCTNDIDDNANGQVDCAEATCAQDLGCALEAGNCADNLDNDGDTFVDCDDFDCDGDAACPAEICSGGIDEDGDSFIDCLDFDCNADPLCGGSAEVCTGGLDEDGDTFIDCNDFDCSADPACVSPEICTGGIDEDGDSFIDCLDFDCGANPACNTEICNNQIDDDGDTFIDCNDFGCTADPACNAGAVQIQQIQNGSITSGSVIVSNVFVTAVRKAANNNNLNVMVQEPQGETIAGVTYPRFAGIQLFINSTTATNLAVPADLKIGDCISVSGVVSEFNAGTQVNNLTAFTRNANAAQCGTVPQAFVATVPSVGTDIDLVTVGNQNGPDSEAFEFVLLKINTFNITTSPDAGGDVNGTQTGGNGEILNIDNFMFSGDNATAIPLAANGVCSDITGIYGQFINGAGTVNKYHLQPRGAADLANCQ